MKEQVNIKQKEIVKTLFNVDRQVVEDGVASCNEQCAVHGFC